MQESPKGAAKPSQPASIFLDATDEAGLDFQHYNSMTGQFYLPEITGSGAALFDYDNDGDLDIFLVQGSVLEPGSRAEKTLLPWRGQGPPRSRLYRNEMITDKSAKGKLRFTDVTMEETNTLYANIGNGLFDDQTLEAGLGLQTRRYTGFGTLWFDYDNDGRLDLLSANGAVRTLADLARKKDPYPLGQPNQLFHNTGKGNFIEASDEAGEAFQLLEVSRGAAFGDIDNDGDTDVILSNNNGRARLLLNQVGNRNHWLGLRLVGAKANRDMLGARVEITLAKESLLLRRARTDGGYCSSHDPRVLAGLGNRASVERVRVRWPSGGVEEWKALPVDRYITLRESTAPQ